MTAAGAHLAVSGALVWDRSARDRMSGLQKDHSPHHVDFGSKTDLMPTKHECPLCARNGRRFRAAHLLALCFFVVWDPVENISQEAINMAAITGPITKPLRPKTTMPPSVEISTT